MPKNNLGINLNLQPGGEGRKALVTITCGENLYVITKTEARALYQKLQEKLYGAKPTTLLEVQKEEIRELPIFDLSGLSSDLHRAAIHAALNLSICLNCGKKVEGEHFKGKISRINYRKTGLCQECQDSTIERGTTHAEATHTDKR